MKKPKLKTLTLLIGILVAISAISMGIGITKSYQHKKVTTGTELPSIHSVDVTKVFYLFFSK